MVLFLAELVAAVAFFLLLFFFYGSSEVLNSLEILLILKVILTDQCMY